MENLNYILDKFNITLDDRTRMPIEIPNYGRDNMAQLFSELGFRKGAEIGVEQGAYSEVLLKANPDLFLFGVDAWQAYRGYRDHTRQTKLDTFYETTMLRLMPYRHRVELIRKFSMDAVKDFADNSLDFVYIDANHDFMNAAQDIHYWSKKVHPGGIVSGHDYIKRRDEAAHVHVKQVMQAYTDAYQIRPWFVLGSEAVVEGQIRDSSRSWMYIKQ